VEETNKFSSSQTPAIIFSLHNQHQHWLYNDPTSTVMHSDHKESTAPQDSTTWVIHLLLSESFSVHGACDDTAASTCSKFLFHPKSNLHLVDAFFSYA
jgi:hypothetical protein